MLRELHLANPVPPGRSNLHLRPPTKPKADSPETATPTSSKVFQKQPRCGHELLQEAATNIDPKATTSSPLSHSIPNTCPPDFKAQTTTAPFPDT